ncbi:MAG TPA: glycosyltransferase family 1 protein [Candidatus Brocadiia bacterium]|nr:glycosyltransferase family 1 protein [Candidatus Brocadiia bacterium]
MRIAIDALNLKPGGGGVEWYLRHLLTALSRKSGDAEFTVFLNENPGEPFPPTRKGFDCIKVSSIGGNRLCRSFYQQTRLDKVSRSAGADVLHCGAYVCPVRHKLPIVVTAHDILAISHPEFCKPLNAFHYKMILPLCLKSAQAIVVPSTWTREQIIWRMPKLEGRIKVISPGVAPEFTAEIKEEDVSKVLGRLGVRRPFILFAGSLEPKKNPGAMAAAFGILKRRHGIPHSLVIAGRINWGVDAALAALKSMGDDVRLLGPVATGDLACLYRSADLMIFPSFAEGFGIPPLEAMACGCPVVASDIPPIVESLGDSAVLVPAAHHEAIAESAARIFSDEAFRQSLIEAGKRRASGFTWEATAQSYLKTYREIAR